MSISATPPFVPPPCRRNANLQNQHKAQDKTQDAPTTHDRHTTSPHLPCRPSQDGPAEPWNPGALGSEISAHRFESYPGTALPASLICAIRARRTLQCSTSAASILQLCLRRHHPPTLPGRSTSPLHLVSCASADSSACPAQPAVKISARSRFPASSVPSAVWCPERTLWCAYWGLTTDKVLSATAPGQSTTSQRPADRQTPELPTHDPGDTSATLIRPLCCALVGLPSGLGSVGCETVGHSCHQARYTLVVPTGIAPPVALSSQAPLPTCRAP